MRGGCGLELIVATSDFVVLFVASIESRIQLKEKPEVYWQNRMYSCKSATDSPIIGGHGSEHLHRFLRLV